MTSEILEKQKRLWQLSQRFTKRDQQLIRNAHTFARHRHRKQRKFDDDMYLLHPVTVAVILLELFESRNPNQIAAALLHDVIEDTDAMFEEVAEVTNQTVAEWVTALTIPGIKTASEAEKYPLKHRYFEERVKPASKFVHQIAVADKLDNISRAWHRSGTKTPEERYKRWLKEAEDLQLVFPSIPPAAKQVFYQAFERLKATVSSPSTLPPLVLIGGMPAAGKSTTAIKLAAKLGTGVVISTDEIRHIMQLYDSSEVLHGRTHDRWQLFGRLNKSNLKKGLYAHAKAVQTGVNAVIAKNAALREPMVVEGVHLLPSFYQDVPGYRTFRIILRPSSLAVHDQLMAAKAERRKIDNLYKRSKVKLLHQLQDEIIRDAVTAKAVILPSSQQAADLIFQLIQGQSRETS